MKPKPQYWLAEIDVHGNPTLVDGAHDKSAGVEQALYLLKRMGLADRKAKYGMVRLTISDVEAKSHGAHEGSVEACNVMLEHANRKSKR